MKYQNDNNDQEMLYDETNDYQTMMEWEKPYMEALVDHLKPFGDVLEVGFGMGYSASQIQKHNINSHTIIENDPTVLNKLREWAVKQPHKVIIIEDTWMNALSYIGKFDSIFFDDAPDFTEDKTVDSRRFYAFYYSVLRNNVNVGARMTWFCFNAGYFIVHPKIEYSNIEFAIDIPDHCKYIPERFKYKNLMFLPLIRFPYGTTSDIVPVVMDENFKSIILGKN